ncbi:putative low complexity [Cryptosporidium sp. chipmunk genotype I]|uniref:putative low complexity n=1 Tax=Cryptosporidium sp. chipmunk genotype I TaxID=1280935 RepID=UPI003519DDE2|nr:putative low complexity [Cryptosporidium sp. chipmunk genotype I]
MQRDVNLRRYILQVFSSPNVVAFASEKARNVLDKEFGVSLNSLLRPLGVESSSKFLWPLDETFKRIEEYTSDHSWQNRACRESCPAFLSLKEVFQNKPKGSPAIWTPQNTIEEITITMQDKEYRNDAFEVRFISLCDPEIIQENDTQVLYCTYLEAIKSYEDFIKQFPYNDLISSSLLHSGGKQFESMLKEFLQNDFEINVNDDLIEFNSELPFWFERWLEAYSEKLNFLNHESISQPIGGIVFVDISEDDPIESIIEITNSLKTGKNFEKLGGNTGYYLFGKKNNSGFINKSNYLSDTCNITKPHYLQESYLNDFPLIYIFINDEKSNFDLMEADHNIISSFKLSFPESICYIWNIKGHDAYGEIKDPTKIVWPGTFSHPFKNINPTSSANRFFDCNEMEQLNSFIIDSIKNNFVPWLEVTINRLCNHVIQSRKGLKNHLRILWRRPRNDNTASSDGLLSTLGVGSTFTNMEERSQIFEHEISLFSSKSNSNGNNSNKGSNMPACLYYSSGSIEGQTRLVADLCLVSGIYSQSIHYYKQILSEYKLDKSFLHIGSAFFSMSVAEILSDFDLGTVTEYCINSSNSFLKNTDEIGTISAIKSLMFLSLVILNSFNFKKRSQDHITAQDVNSFMINNVCKNIVSSLSKISNEFQISQPNLRPRSLFSINKMDSQDHSKDSVINQYLSDLKKVTGIPNVYRENSISSIFGVINYVISRVLYLSSSLSDLNFRIQSNPMNLSHCWSIHTAQAAQVFQDLGFFGISLKHYLTILLYMDRFKYKHIDRYLKLHSARLCQKLSLLAQSTLLYSSLILDIINDKISSNHEICSRADSNLELIWLQISESGSSTLINEHDVEIGLICYREFIRSFVIYKQGEVRSNTPASEPNHIFSTMALNNFSNVLPSQTPTTFLKIPLPVLLAVGTVLILETDYESLFKAFGKKENGTLNRTNCTCNDKISNILDQKKFCNHKSKPTEIEVPGTTILRSKSQYENYLFPGQNFSKQISPRYYNNRNEDEFQSLLEKANRLLDHESFLESSEAAELRSQYILRRNKENNSLKNSHKPPSISPSNFSNSIRFSFIGKVCSIEFYLHNPLSFPIVCESLQIWGHLRLHDGSTAATHTLKDNENYNIGKQSKGTVFFEKSIILNPNETIIQKLSVIPLEAGELFLVGISFLLDGKIPIRQNFGASYINLDRRLTSKLGQTGNFNYSNFNKEHFGIQKINILGHSYSSSIHFGNISQKLFDTKNSINMSQDQGADRYRNYENQHQIKHDYFDNNSLVLYSGVPYTLPISISSEKNANACLKDSTLLVIPCFSNNFNIQMRYKHAPPEMSNSIINFSSSGCVFKLPTIELQRAHEFDLTLWVNSECSGNVYFLLLNSNSSCENLATGDTVLASSSKSKTNRSIIFASLSFYFTSSVSMSCTVLPGKEETLNRLLLRIRNQVPKEVLIYDISAYPSKWVEKYNTELKTNNIQERPTLTLSLKNHSSKEFQNGNLSQSNQLRRIPPNGTFQIFLNLESKNRNTFSISKINLILSWVLSEDDKSLDYLNSTHLLSGQICIYNINLFDPYSIPFNGNKNDEDKYQPLSISMNTKDLDHLSENSLLDGDIHLVETSITLTNITIQSTIICSLICNSKFLTCQSLQDDLLLPSESLNKNKNSQESSSILAQGDENLNLNQRISSALESGELKWVGPTVTHIKLNPRSSKRLKLIAVVPFKGIFSTNTIQLLIREKYPFFPSYIRLGNKGDLKNYTLNNHHPDIFFYISYMKWMPQLFINQNDKPISRYPIKTDQDCLIHTFSYFKGKSSCSNNNNRNLLPAYIENKGSFNKKPGIHQLSKKSSIEARSKDNLLIQKNEICNINKLNATILDKWLKNEESAFDNGGNVKIINNSNTYGTANLPQNYLKRRLIVQRPHQSYFLIRM